MSQINLKVKHIIYFLTCKVDSLLPYYKHQKDPQPSIFTWPWLIQLLPDVSGHKIFRAQKAWTRSWGNAAWVADVQKKQERMAFQ